MVRFDREKTQSLDANLDGSTTQPPRQLDIISICIMKIVVVKLIGYQ